MQLNMILDSERRGDTEAAVWVLLAKNRTGFARCVIAAYGNRLEEAYRHLRRVHGEHEVSELVGLALGPALDGLSDLVLLSPDQRRLLETVVLAIRDLGLELDAAVLLLELEGRVDGVAP